MSSISDIPDDMLLEIFGKCSVSDIGLKIACVCRHWQELVEDETFWQTLYQRDSGDTISSTDLTNSGMTWKELYRDLTAEAHFDPEICDFHEISTEDPWAVLRTSGPKLAVSIESRRTGRLCWRFQAYGNVNLDVGVIPEEEIRNQHALSHALAGVAGVVLNSTTSEKLPAILPARTASNRSSIDTEADVIEVVADMMHKHLTVTIGDTLAVRVPIVHDGHMRLAMTLWAGGGVRLVSRGTRRISTVPIIEIDPSRGEPGQRIGFEP